jgi:hypothetical protein
VHSAGIGTSFSRFTGRARKTPYYANCGNRKLARGLQLCQLELAVSYAIVKAEIISSGREFGNLYKVTFLDNLCRLIIEHTYIQLRARAVARPVASIDETRTREFHSGKLTESLNRSIDPVSRFARITIGVAEVPSLNCASGDNCANYPQFDFLCYFLEPFLFAVTCRPKLSAIIVIPRLLFDFLCYFLESFVTDLARFPG